MPRRSRNRGPTGAGGAAGIPVLYDYDFSGLSLGGHSAASFLTATGLTFARSTTSTVQTSASTLVAGVAIDAACIGATDGTKKGLVIQHNVRNLVGVIAGAASPRNLNTEWAAGTSVVVTYPFADSPDGSGTGCSRANVSSNGFAPFGDPFGATSTTRHVFSSWQRSVNSASNGAMQQVIIASVPGDGTQTTRAASNTWGRIVTAKGTAALRYFDTVDGRNYTASGGQAAQARDILVDYIQLERSDFATEAIPTALTRRGNDRVSHATGSRFANGGRMRLYMRFYPKHASTSDVYFDGSGAQGTAGSWYLWSYGSNSYARINASTKRLEVVIAGGTTRTSTNAFSWAALDDVELYLEVGGNVASVASYRVNSGAWNALALPTETASVAPSGAFSLMMNDAGSSTGDSGQLPCWLRRVTSYGANGAVVV